MIEALFKRMGATHNWFAHTHPLDYSTTAQQNSSLLGSTCILLSGMPKNPALTVKRAE